MKASRETGSEETRGLDRTALNPKVKVRTQARQGGTEEDGG